MQTDATLLSASSNIFGCYMLSPFAHPVACCCAKFETGQTFSHVQLPTMLGVVLLRVVGQQCCFLLHLPTMLGVVGQQFCNRMHGALVTVILIIFSNISFSLLIIPINFCPIYPALYVARKISLNFLFWGT